MWVLYFCIGPSFTDVFNPIDLKIATNYFENSSWILDTALSLLTNNFIMQYSKTWVKINTEDYSVFIVPEYAPPPLLLFMFHTVHLLVPGSGLDTVPFCDVWISLSYIDCLLQSVLQQMLVVTVRETLHTCLMWLSSGFKSSTPLTTECTEYADFQMYKTMCE